MYIMLGKGKTSEEKQGAVFPDGLNSSNHGVSACVSMFIWHGTSLNQGALLISMVISKQQGVARTAAYY